MSMRKKLCSRRMLIRAAGFHLGDLESGYMRERKPWTYLYQGWATRH
jgi:hypothetical protein